MRHADAKNLGGESQESRSCSRRQIFIRRFRTVCSAYAHRETRRAARNVERGNKRKKPLRAGATIRFFSRFFLVAGLEEDGRPGDGKDPVSKHRENEPSGSFGFSVRWQASGSINARSIREFSNFLLLPRSNEPAVAAPREREKRGNWRVDGSFVAGEVQIKDVAVRTDARIRSFNPGIETIEGRR